jgi:hypothetical protein
MRPVSRRKLLTGAAALLVMPKLPLRAAAQIALDPITVTATPIILDPGIGTLFDGGQAQQFGQILRFLVAQERYRQEQLRQQQLIAQQPLVNFMVLPEEPAPAPPETEPAVIFLPRSEDFLWGGDEAYIQQQLEARAVDTTTALTAIYALKASVNLVNASMPIAREGMKLVAAGLAAGTIGLMIENLATGAFMVGFVGAGMLAIFGGLVFITVRYIYPEIGQQITIFGNTLFSYDIDIQSQPLTQKVEELATVAPITKDSTPDAAWSEKQWNDYYMAQDKPYGEM